MPGTEDSSLPGRGSVSRGVVKPMREGRFLGLL